MGETFSDIAVVPSNDSISFSFGLAPIASIYFGARDPRQQSPTAPPTSVAL